MEWQSGRKLSLAIGGSEKKDGPPDSLSIHVHFYTISTFICLLGSDDLTKVINSLFPK